MNHPERLREQYGPWALVTGASEGIGRAFAIELARAGLHLVLIARREDLLRELADDMRKRFGVQCHAVGLDLARPDAAERLAHVAGDRDFGLLVAAAGFGTSGPFIAADPVVEQELVQVNCIAVLAQCWHFGNRFAARRRGGIVLMSSVVAFNGTPFSANYAASKAYVQSLAEGLRMELGVHGVDVIASAPGPIHSGFARRAKMRMDRALQPEVVARQTLAALGQRGTVRPGWLSKMLGWSLSTAPRALRVVIMSCIMRGMAVQGDPPVADWTGRRQ